MKVIVAIFIMTYGCVTAAKYCDEQGSLLYEDIGCKAVEEKNEGCPVKYECGDFKTKNNCLFKGRSLNVGEQLANNLTYNSCNVGCFCEESGKFTCAALDCPEWLGVPTTPNCYRKHEVGQCCSVGEICPQEGVPVSTCEVDGRTYREGETFTPKDTCLNCVCPKNFNGKYEEPHCERIQCGTQIYDSQELAKKCAPVYSDRNSTVLCCPDTWLCPDASVEYFKGNDDITSDLQCHFGDKTIKLGGGLNAKTKFIGGDIKAVTCKCVMPPFLLCKED